MTFRLTRSLAALLLLAGGMIHFHLWESGYRHIPKIGPLFLANSVGSVVLAAVVPFVRRAAVSVTAIAFAAMSLVALILSRTVGVFGFTELVWTPDAVKTLASEIGVILVLGFTLILQTRAAGHQTSSVRLRAPY
jgi:EamA domain-containing membrane protein RarD